MSINSFGQVIQPNGPDVGYAGKISRMGGRQVVAKLVLPSTPSNLLFGAGAVEISNSIGGYWQPLADFLATPANAALLMQKFAGVAVAEVKTQVAYLPQLAQGSSVATVVNTTMTQGTVGSTTITVASNTGLVAGQSMEGFGLQANTTAVGISGTTVTISLPTIAVIQAGTPVTFTSPLVQQAGFYAPGQMAELATQYNIMVPINYGTPQADLPVYIRTVLNANLPGTSLGGFEAADDVATTSITTTTTVGSATLTTSAGTGLAAGQRVVAPGVPNNTYLVSGAGTTWTMSQAATATTATQAASFSNSALLGSLTDPWLVFRTGQLGTDGIAEIVIKVRHAA